MLVMNCSYHLAVPLVVMTKFDPFLFCATIEKYKVTYINVVPPILLALARHPGKTIYLEHVCHNSPSFLFISNQQI
jgi:hypothetical protein